MKKLNIIYRTCRTEFYPIPSELGPGESPVSTACKQKIETFTGETMRDITKQVKKWDEVMSVSAGEEGGSFRILGAIEGEIADLAAGPSKFLTPKNIQLRIEELEYEEEHNP